MRGQAWHDRLREEERRLVLGRDQESAALVPLDGRRMDHGGVSCGEPDESRFKPAVAPVSVHDRPVTILHWLGVDHERLTYIRPQVRI